MTKIQIVSLDKSEQENMVQLTQIISKIDAYSI